MPEPTTDTRATRLTAATRWATRIVDGLCSGPAVGGLLAVIAFVLGALSLNELSYFGTQSDELKQIAIQKYGADMAVEHLQILALYLAIGLTGGLLSSGIFALRDHLRGQGPASRLWRFSRHALLLCGLHAYFLFDSIIRYPQLYAESFYDRGGLRRGIQVVLTDWIPPTLCLVLVSLVLCLIALGPALGALRRLPARLRSQPPRLRPALAWAASLALLAAITAGAALGTGSRQATANQGPNILILAVDSFRADRLLEPRYRRAAPRLQTLARRSLHFTRAYSTLARTFPSWTTMLTGREPHDHGIRHMFPSWESRRRVGLALPRHLRRAGWTTAVVSDYAGEIFGRIDYGFEHEDVASFSFYEMVRQRILKAHLHLLPYLSGAVGRRLAPPLAGTPENADPFLMARRVNRMLDRVAGKKRFMLLAFFSAAHFPYAAPHPYYKRFTSRSYDGPFKYHKQRLLKDRTPSARDIRHIRGLFDGSIAAADAAIGQVLDHLERLGIADKTIVIITADHGENLYEANLGMGHGDHLRGEVANRLPLLLHDPVHRFRPRRIQATVRDVDLAPTLAALMGQTMPGVAGENLVPLLKGRPRKDERPAYMETGLWFTAEVPGVGQDMRLQYPPVLGGLVVGDMKRQADLVLNPKYEKLVVAAKHRAIVQGKWKLIYVPLADGVRTFLYDTTRDPDNLRDVSARHPAVKKRLLDRLHRWMRGERGSLQVGPYVLPGQ